MTGVDLFGSAFEGHGSAPPVNRYICMPSIFKRRCLHRLFPKSTCKFQCIGELYHRFKQNVSESESRQFDRLRLRLRLLARSHDSGSDSAPLFGSHYGQFDYLGILQCEREKLNELSRAKKCQNILVHC